MSRSRIEAGRFRNRVTILQLDDAQLSSGGIDPRNYSIFLTTWAKVETLTGRALSGAQQEGSSVTHKVSIRYAPGIVARQVVGHGERYFTIAYLSDPDGRGKLLELFCEEKNDSVRVKSTVSNE